MRVRAALKYVPWLRHSHRIGSLWVRVRAAFGDACVSAARSSAVFCLSACAKRFMGNVARLLGKRATRNLTNCASNIFLAVVPFYPLENDRSLPSASVCLALGFASVRARKKGHSGILLASRPMRALGTTLLHLSAASAFLTPPLSHQRVHCTATQQQACSMNAEGEFPIPELRVVNQLRHQLTYAGCEDDVRLAESYWTAGYPGNIQEEVNSMRRKQQLHEGDRSDVVLQVLDDVKRQLTYPDWKHDVSLAEENWAAGNPAGVRKDIEEMRRRQQLQKGDRSDVVLQVLDDVKSGS